MWLHIILKRAPSMTESEISTESVDRSMLLKRIIYLASLIFSSGLKMGL